MSDLAIQITHLNDVEWRSYGPVGFDPGDSTHVWCIRVRENLAAIEEMTALLSTGERERAARFRLEPDRERFIIGRACLRLLLATYLNLQPKDLIIERGKDYKPVAKLPVGIAPIHFNISHSGDIVLIAFDSEEVGIDIEIQQPGFNYEELMPVCLSKQECAFVKASDNPVLTFYTLWTRKEAQLKVTGTGITDDLKTTPSLDGNYNTGINVQNALNYQFVKSFNIGEKYVCSVATHKKKLFFCTYHHSILP
jgi:4'-phosphopantetheinyl transferase